MDDTGLVIGLGNPGLKYHETRHNMGFMVLDLLAEMRGAAGHALLEREREERGLCTVHRFFPARASGRWYAIRPQTFMNLSGRAVVWAANYYKTAPGNILVIHDELDLPLGTLRFKRSGGTAGHNGLRSISELTGTRDFPRLRLGIGKPANENTAGYVLGRFEAAEQDTMRKVVEAAAQAVLLFMDQGLSIAMQETNGLDLSDTPES